MSAMPSSSALAQPLHFSDVPSIKLPRTAAYVPNNFVAYTNAIDNTSYYAIIHGLEVWIVKHPEPSRSVAVLKQRSKREPTIQLRKVPYDSIEQICCVSWLRVDSDVLFAMGTQSGKMYFYDFDCKKLLLTHQIAFDAKQQYNTPPTVNCLCSDNCNKLFVGLSNGLLLSYDIQETSLSNRRVIYNCYENDDWSHVSHNSSNGQNGASIADKTKSESKQDTMPSEHSRNNNNSSQTDGGKVDSGNSSHETAAQSVTCVGYDNTNGIGKVYAGLDNGNVISYDCNLTKIEYIVDRQWNPHGIPATCMAVCHQFVVVGYATGFVIVIQKTIVSTQIKKVSLHRRAVTAVTIQPQLNLIATVSEDGYMHVLSNNSNGVELVRSLLFEHTSLIGTQFVAIEDDDATKQPPKPEHCVVMITAYDRNRIVFV